MTRGRTRFLIAAAAVAALFLVLGAYAYLSAIREAEGRVNGGSEVLLTSHGRLEYAVTGSGIPVLMVHGTGGGFDQGLTFTEGLVPQGFKVIAPSRFGYLRSDFPEDPSSERQADAYVELLDHLGIEKIAIAGGSAGALSAAQFALRYPERCAALILVVPAANVRGRDPVEMSPAQAYAVRRLTSSNILFWGASQIARDQMIGTLLATDPELLRKARESERMRAHRILDEIMPVSRRSQGMLNDARLAGQPARMDFTQIRVPTLVVSAKDDRFGTAETAKDIAGAVPGARLLLFADGGHIWIGHDEQLWGEVATFLRDVARRQALAGERKEPRYDPPGS